MIGDPLGAVRLAVAIFGAWMIFAGAVTLLRLLMGPEPTVEDLPSVRALRRRLFPVVVGALLLIGDRGRSASGSCSTGAPAVQPVVNTNPGCNGFTELCDQAAERGHARDDAQRDGLRAGAVHQPQPGRRHAEPARLGDPRDAARRLPRPAQRQRHGPHRPRAEGRRGGRGEDRRVAGWRAAQRLAGSVAFGPVSGKKQLYLCHVVCELGALEAVPAFRKIKDWMDRNPREVLMFIIEDAAPTAAIKQAFEDSGLAAYANDVPVGDGQPFPTLEQMIDSGKRLWVMAEAKGEPTGWYRQAYAITQETPFAFTSVGLLRSPTSCRPNRGGTRQAALPDEPLGRVLPAAAARRRRREQAAVPPERAHECERARDARRQLLAVDFAERGDVLAATDSLNGVKTSPAVP